MFWVWYIISVVFIYWFLKSIIKDAVKEANSEIESKLDELLDIYYKRYPYLLDDDEINDPDLTEYWKSKTTLEQKEK